MHLQQTFHPKTRNSDNQFLDLHTIVFFQGFRRARQVFPRRPVRSGKWRPSAARDCREARRRGRCKAAVASKFVIDVAQAERLNLRRQVTANARVEVLRDFSVACGTGGSPRGEPFQPLPLPRPFQPLRASVGGPDQPRSRQWDSADDTWAGAPR